jgi:hypothetical protein
LGHGKKPGFSGSFILTSFSESADALPAAQVDLYKTLPIRDVTASSSHPDYPAVGAWTSATGTAGPPIRTIKPRSTSPSRSSNRSTPRSRLT